MPPRHMRLESEAQVRYDYFLTKEKSKARKLIKGNNQNELQIKKVRNTEI